MRKVFMRTASLFLWVVMFIAAACIGYAAEEFNQESSVIETVTTETSDNSAYDETTETSTEETTTEEVKEWTLVEHTEDDITVIPDKYNTGCKGELEAVAIGATVEGVEFKSSTSDTRNALDFYYRNKDVKGTVVFENYDFSDYHVWTYNEDKVDRGIKLIFNNCKFSEIVVGKTDSNLSYEFNNCTIGRFIGSNATFNNCFMGVECCTDALVPFRNVEINNSFFGNMSAESNSDKEIHLDATQIYGQKDINVQNVHYNNCRFETPNVIVEGSKVYVNACLMLQLEYSDGNNISFTDCIVNGGGYSIYARALNDFTLEDVQFENIRFGCARKYGMLYPNVSAGVELKDITETDCLYVASVRKIDGNVHISVSNDTNQERELLVVTDSEQYRYSIPACPTGMEMEAGLSYEELPFDIDIVVPENCEYVICYDVTTEGAAKQIRFVNWSKDDVYLEKEVIVALTCRENEVISSGKCGTNVDYTLTISGILTLSGQGKTDNYHSAKLPPWNEYKNIIKEIVIEDGIEEIGTQIFRDCTAVQKVVLPKKLKIIGQRAFAGCSSIISVTIPASVTAIGDAAFSGTSLTTVYYEGDNWGNIDIGSGNEALEFMVSYVQCEADSADIVMSGQCGKQVEFILTDDGIMRIKGTGDMYNYHSQYLPPWNDMKASITKVIIEEGIESVGNQAFRNCDNLVEVVLPDGLKVIGNNTFSTCRKICNIVIPRTVLEIYNYAFANISLIDVQYMGSFEEWNQMVIGIKNEGILSGVIYNG